MRPCRKPQARQSLEQDGQGDLHFETGEWRADAEMNAGAEGDVRQKRPRRVEAAGMVMAARIAVGGTEEETDLLALPQLDAFDLDRLESVAIEEMERRIEAERLFDNRRR